MPLARRIVPLLHLEVGSKLVRQIKPAQHMAGFGSELVRAPRLLLEAAERGRVRAIVQQGPQLRGLAPLSWRRPWA